jgi:hypothetical protein
MPLITSRLPDKWDELEDLVTAILNECGMNARRKISLKLPRGNVVVDVYAEDIVDGIVHRTICECKNWNSSIPKDVVHGFRTVMQETGAHRGYIISRVGFQSGAIEAAGSTNIELVTFGQFQNAYLEKWFDNRLWAIENQLHGFHSYYEPPFAPPGYVRLENERERAAYDEVWDKFRFAGEILRPFSPYLRMRDKHKRKHPYPALPFDVSELEKEGIQVPDDIKAAAGYREFFELLTRYASQGLEELRAVNPLTRDKLPDSSGCDD